MGKEKTDAKIKSLDTLIQRYTVFYNILTKMEGLLTNWGKPKEKKPDFHPGGVVYGLGRISLPPFLEGLDTLQRLKIIQDSLGNNLQEEFRKYKWGMDFGCAPCAVAPSFGQSQYEELKKAMKGIEHAVDIQKFKAAAEKLGCYNAVIVAHGKENYNILRNAGVKCELSEGNSELESQLYASQAQANDYRRHFVALERTHERTVAELDALERKTGWKLIALIGILSLIIGACIGGAL